MAQYLSIAGLGLALLGCASSSPSPADVPPESHGPTISSVAPLSGPVGPAYPIEIVLVGTGFAEADNIVHFGNIQVGSVSSSENGTRISFMAPKQRQPTGGAAPMVLMPGRYPITVTVAGKRSEPVDFQLVRGGGDRG